MKGVSPQNVECHMKYKLLLHGETYKWEKEDKTSCYIGNKVATSLVDKVGHIDCTDSMKMCDIYFSLCSLH